MTTLIGMAGSLRAGSFNAALLRAAAPLMPAGTHLDIASIKDIPLHDGDVQAREEIPPTVTALKDRIAAADGLLLVAPEYNNASPGVFKNALDWLSRRPADGACVFANRRVAVIGASPGGFGTILIQNAWLPVLRRLGTRPWFGARLMVARAGNVFNAQGELVDEKIKLQLQQFLNGFVHFVKS
jgi:NAD(P)H-dependent FMN reductase